MKLLARRFGFVLGVLAITTSLVAAQDTNDPHTTLIAFVSGDGVIEVMRPDGSGRRALAEGDGEPLWSPDGQTLAFTQFAGVGEEQQAILTLIDVDGTNLRQISGFARAVQDVAWSPNGAWIAFTTLSDWDVFGGLYVARVDGDEDTSDARRIPGGSGATHIRWSPDGSRIAFLASDDDHQRLYLAEADGSLTRRVTDAISVLSFSWAVDGQQMALMGGQRLGDLQIWWIDVDRGDPVPITRGDAKYCHPRFSPNARDIAYVRSANPHRCGTGDLFLARPVDPVGWQGGGDARQLTDHRSVLSGSYHWTPDAAFIYYRAYDVEQGTRKIDLDGNELPMPPEFTSAERVLPSPQGDQLMFASGPQGERRVYLMNADGTDLRVLAEDALDFRWPSWQP